MSGDVLLGDVSHRFDFCGPQVMAGFQSGAVLVRPPSFGLRFLARTIAASRFIQNHQPSQTWENALYTVPSRLLEGMNGAQIEINAEAMQVTAYSTGRNGSPSAHCAVRETFRFPDTPHPYRPVHYPRATVQKICDTATQNCKSGHAYTSAVAVVQDGVIIGQSFAPHCVPDRFFELGSISKFFLSLIIGHSISQGILRCDSKCASQGSARNSSPASLPSVENLLDMRSGFDPGHWPVAVDDLHHGEVSIADMLKRIRPLDDAGSKVRYSNFDALMLVNHLQEVLHNGDVAAFAMRFLTRSLRMQTVRLEKTFSGETPFTRGVWATISDLASAAAQLTAMPEDLTHAMPRGWDARYYNAPAQLPENGGLYPFASMVWRMGGCPGLTPLTYCAIGYSWNFLMILPEHRLAIIRLSDRPVFELRARFPIESLGAEVRAAITR